MPPVKGTQKERDENAAAPKGGYVPSLLWAGVTAAFSLLRSGVAILLLLMGGAAFPLTFGLVLRSHLPSFDWSCLSPSSI